MGGQETFTVRFLDFLSSAPSPYHAAAEIAEQLDQAGFTQLSKADQWPSAPGKYYVHDEGALVAWIFPERTPNGFSIVGTHTDSPSLKIKPTPQRTTADGWGQLLTEVYGGPLLNSWLDRELLIAGLVVDKQGKRHLARTGPLARIPQLAVHLDRAVNTEGLKLDPQQHLQPVWTVDNPDVKVLDSVARAAGLHDAEDIGGTDLFLYPSQPPALFGSDNQFVAAGRQDNLSSVFAGLAALLKVGDKNLDSERIPVFAAFDNEEVGSNTAHGAHGPILPNTLRRIALGLGQDFGGYQQMLARSTLISADATHSVNPSHPTVHDPDTRPVIGRGPAIKLNANQRYATTAEGQALWRRICEKSGIPSQAFVSESSIPSGSTIGPGLATSLGIPTVDVGVPLLSMHSAREMTHVADTYWLAQALETYLSGTV